MARTRIRDLEARVFGIDKSLGTEQYQLDFAYGKVALCKVLPSTDVVDVSRGHQTKKDLGVFLDGLSVGIHLAQEKKEGGNHGLF